MLFIGNYLLFINNSTLPLCQSNQSIKMKTERILQILRVGAWIVYIGAIIRTVMLAAAFVISYFKDGIDFQSSHLFPSIAIFSLLLAIAVLHVQVWEKVKDTLTQINLENPFSMKTSQQMISVAHLLLSVWIVSFISKNYLQYVNKRMVGAADFVQSFDFSLVSFDVDGVYLLNAGIVYIIAQVFKRGVELQQENELTI